MNITIVPAKKPMNFQYWSVAKINKEMFYEMVAHYKKIKSSKRQSKIKLENNGKAFRILRYKHKDILLLLKNILGEKPHCWQKNISSEMLLHWVSSNFFLDDI